MIEYFILGLASLAIAWLGLRHRDLQRQIGSLESALSQLQIANPDTFEESVAQMITELNAAADRACQQVTQRIDALKKTRAESEESPAETSSTAVNGESLPVALIAQLADQGLSTIDIARQIGTGPAEVELTLRLHRGRRQAVPVSQPLGTRVPRPARKVASA